MKENRQNSELDHDEVLVNSLRVFGVRFLGPTPSQPENASPLPAREVPRAADPAQSAPDAVGVDPLLILNPDLATEIQNLVQQLPNSSVRELQALYTAAVYLQAFWRTRLSFYLGNFKLLPDLYSGSLQLPSSQERHGKIGLRALAAWHGSLSPFPSNRLASYNKMMDLLFEQLKVEARRREPASIGWS